jgi:hypothetical protein
MLKSLKMSSDRVVKILNSNIGRLDMLIKEEDYMMLRQFIASCFNLVSISYYIDIVKTEENIKGELNLTPVIKLIS